MRGWILFIGGIAIMALSRTIGPITEESIQRIARAIARAEGYGVPGAIPTVRNNPGNLKMSGTNEITTYPTIADGWNALYRQVRLMVTGTSKVYKPTMTLEQVARKYTGEAAFMNWASNVARALGVSTSTTLQELV